MVLFSIVLLFGSAAVAQIVEDPSLPIAELAATHVPEDPTEAATRAARSAYFNDPIRLPLTPTSRETILAGGYGGTIRSPLELTRQAAAIFAGTVMSANANVTEDRRWVYSEFVVSADTILKDTPGRITLRAPVTVVRAGGALRLPDGGVIRLKVGRQGYPQIGERYLFFADTNRAISAYPLVSAYSLGTATQETVRRLDADTRLPSFAGLTPAALLEAVTQLIGQGQ